MTISRGSPAYAFLAHLVDGAVVKTMLGDTVEEVRFQISIQENSLAGSLFGIGQFSGARRLEKFRALSAGRDGLAMLVDLVDES